MANNCEYEIKILGTKEHCDEFVKRMKSYSEPNHFWRFFDINVSRDCEEDGKHCVIVNGDCAWSLESCCRASGYSNGADLFAVNTKELDLMLEAWSSEPGMEFQEHYIYDHGDCLEEECVNYEEHYYDPDEYGSFEDFKKKVHADDDMTEFDLQDGYYCVGGFDNIWSYVI